MNIKSILLTAMAVFVFASCSNDDDNTNISGSNGEKAIVGISFTLPQGTSDSSAKHAPVTRTQDASTVESAVNTVAVYIFNASNGLAANKGGYTLLSSTDFNQTGTTYELSGSKNITTVAGNHVIYVAVNLPTPTAYANETALLAAIAEVSKLDNSDTTTGFTMFSTAKPTNIKEYDKDDATTITKVVMDIDRIVSKVVTTSNDATYTATWSNGVELTYTVKEFGVYQEAVKTYLVKHTTTLSTSDATALNDYAKSVLKDNETVAIGTNYTQGSAVLTNLTDGFYIGENIPTETLNKNTTYVMVATKVVTNKFAAWDDTNEVVVWNTASYNTADDDIYIVNVAGTSYITNVEADAIELAQELSGTYYTYPEGYVHFQVFLNPDVMINKYAISRNEFIHVKVTNVKTIDGYFPGYPGDENDPEKPIDPNENDGKNPDPKDPDELVDGTPGALNVEITVNPWTYKENSVELQ